jgi:hypothetical protein
MFAGTDIQNCAQCLIRSGHRRPIRGIGRSQTSAAMICVQGVYLPAERARRRLRQTFHYDGPLDRAVCYRVAQAKCGAAHRSRTSASGQERFEIDGSVGGSSPRFHVLIQHESIHHGRKASTPRWWLRDAGELADDWGLCRMHLDGKVAVVSGGGSGISRAAVLALVARGRSSLPTSIRRRCATVAMTSGASVFCALRRRGRRISRGLCLAGNAGRLDMHSTTRDRR